MQECRDESEIKNYQRIQLSNDALINGILGSTLDLACHVLSSCVSLKLFLWLTVNDDVACEYSCLSWLWAFGTTS